MLTHEKICNAIASLADQYSLTRASYFGSYANGLATEKSDLDLLVEFTRPSVSVWHISGLKLDLQDILHTKIDVVHAPIPEDSYLIIDKTVLAYEN
ncbi:MAG: nucleotidyltransferase domain-containing protein [Holophagaceae bacterium]|nr:nucleotidyltransferase domain-containing protein [Holophagaceae bacterium]